MQMANKGQKEILENSNQVAAEHMHTHTQDQARCLRQKEGKTSQDHTRTVACGRGEE